MDNTIEVIAAVGKYGEMIPCKYRVLRSNLHSPPNMGKHHGRSYIMAGAHGAFIYAETNGPTGFALSVDTFLNTYKKSDDILILLSISKDVTRLWFDLIYQWVHPLFHPTVRARLNREEPRVYLESYRKLKTAACELGNADEDSVDYY